ncbi:MAG: phosphomannomutase/phosphoglucomutase, partial [Betaproteobacteria bacterium]
DGIYAGARLLEYLSKQESIDDTFTSLPNSLSTPEIQIKCSEGENFSIIEELKKTGEFATAQEKITIDGLRLEYADGFGLARASNTTPTIVLRFESDSQDGLARIHNEFKEAFRQINENLGFPEIIPA